MVLLRKLTDLLVPSTALTGWIVPLRRVDSLKEKLVGVDPPGGPLPKMQELATGRWVDPMRSLLGINVVLTPLVPEDAAIKNRGVLYVHPLTWDGGLAPWRPNETRA